MNSVVQSPILIKVVVTSIFLLIFLNLPLTCSSHGHGHSHDHDHEFEESPSYKYSREANVYINEHQSDHIHKSDTDNSKHKSERDLLALWMQALGSTLIISIAPFIVLFLVPLDNSKEHEPFLKILLSFASGSLLGDAFLHLIPHALSPHSHEQGHGHSHEQGHGHSHDHKGTDVHNSGVGIWVLMGIVTFLVVEKFVRLMKGGHGHSHSTVSDKAPNKKGANDGAGDKIKESDKKKKEANIKSTKRQSAHEGEIKVSGYLNLAADFTHNFTDGLAIGASYIAGKNIGIVTTITILFHEVPHEIGDFAILIQSGCNRRKAILLQLVTAAGAFAGTVVSLLAEGLDEATSSWILPFTAGGFIYIATVSVIPELLVETKFWQSVKEIIALIFGVFMMVLIAAYE